MGSLPSGTVTFLFTDIQGSTKLAQKYPQKWESMRKRHNDILQSAMNMNCGYVFQIIGDAYCVAFHTAGDAVRAAVQVQIALHEEKWEKERIKVRIGIHTGQAQIQERGDYHGYLSLSRVQRLMSAAHGGQVLLSLAAQELVRDELPENVSLRDMGEKRLKDLIRPEHIYQLTIADLPVDFPPIKTLDAYRHNLPIQLTTFVGREKEMAEIRQAVMEHRLVTLIGAGGTGKTRLSLHVAADLLDQFPHGIWFVELAPLTNPELISQTTLSAVGAGDQPGLTSLQSLTDYVRGKKLLIVLDNCEHIIAEAAKLATTLLTTAGDLKILATSRECLGVEGEVNWYVPSLSLPDVQHLPAMEVLSQYEAVRLFIDRATLVQPHFTVTRENAPAIAQICHRLDGIPLAIELAAARVKALDIELIARRLDDRFSLLTGGNRTALPRHQTLRAAIDWGYELLTPPEKTFFRRLAVFADGWPLEAAEQVCKLDDENMNILDLLVHLVDKSLVVMDNSAGTSRYKMLETTRQYANEKLTASREDKVIRNRHCNWYLELAKGYKEQIYGPNELLWTRRLEAELENMRAALEWSFGVGASGSTGAEIVGNFAEFLNMEGYHGELLFWLEKAEKETRGQMQSPIRARILFYCGLDYIAALKDEWKDNCRLLEESLEIYSNLGDIYRSEYAHVKAALAYNLYLNKHDHETCYAYLKEAIDIFRDTSNKQGQGFALRLFSNAKLHEGDIAAAIASAEEAAALYRASGDQIDTAVCASIIGRCNLAQENYREAKRYFENALELCRKFGFKAALTAAILHLLGDACRGLEEYTEAEECYRESLNMCQETGTSSKEFIPLYLNLGCTVLHQGNRKQAVFFFKEALILSRKWADQQGLILGLAGLAAAQGNTQESAFLFGVVNSQIQKWLVDGNQFDLLLSPVDRREFDHYQASCRERLGNSAFESAMERGCAITLDAAIASALEQTVN